MNQLQDDKEVVAVLDELVYQCTGKRVRPSQHVESSLPREELEKATKTLTELIAKRENRALIKGYDLGIQSWAEGKKRVKEVRKQLSSTTPKGKDN